MLETLNLSTEKKQPTATSSEEFTAALEAVIQNETVTNKTEDKEQVTELDETDLDLEEEDMSWSLWNKQPMLFEPPVNLEQLEPTTELDGIAEVALIETIDTDPTVALLQTNLTDETLLSDIIELNPLQSTELQKNAMIESASQFSIDDYIPTETIDGETIRMTVPVETSEMTLEMTGDQIPADILEDNVGLVETVIMQSDPPMTQEVENKEPLELHAISNGIVEETIEFAQVTASNPEVVEPVETNAFYLMDKTEVDVELELEDTKIGTSSSELNQAMADIRGLQTSKEIVMAQEPVKVAESKLIQKMEVLVVEQLESTGEIEKVSTTRIQLTPDSLGELDIELTLKNKQLTAKIVVEYAETKEWLEQKVAELTTKLAVQDIQVQEFEIVVAQNEQLFMNLSFEENPFFKQQKESTKQIKSLTDKAMNEPEVEGNTSNTNDAGAGRLSIWV